MTSIFDSWIRTFSERKKFSNSSASWRFRLVLSFANVHFALINILFLLRIWNATDRVTRMKAYVFDLEEQWLLLRTIPVNDPWCASSQTCPNHACQLDTNTAINGIRRYWVDAMTSTPRPPVRKWRYRDTVEDTRKLNFISWRTSRHDTSKNPRNAPVLWPSRAPGDPSKASVKR